MEYMKDLLQVSAKLYKHLANVPKSEDRYEYIAQIDLLLEERGTLIDQLINSNFVFNVQDESHKMLYELDRGIRERLAKVMDIVKLDMKDLQNAKKNEKQYFNPYSDLQTMDGMYYDKKK